MTTAAVSLPAPSARNRVAVGLAGIMALLAVFGYGWGAPGGLVTLAVILTVLAVLLPRSLPGTTRAVVWTAVAIVVACLSANLARISPDEAATAGSLIDSSPYDRLVTVAMGLALTALFFKPSRTTLTVTAACCMPAIMIALLRDHTPFGAARGGWIIWVFFALLALTEQSQRTIRRLGDAEGWRLLAWRLWAPMLALALAASLTGPLGEGARYLREQSFGVLTAFNPLMMRTRRGAELSVFPPSVDWAGQVRLMAAVRAPSRPGYLREAVYRQYQAGRWLPPSAGDILAADMPFGSDHAQAWRYVLHDSFADDLGESVEWRLRLPSPRRLAGMLLPGGARAFDLDADENPRRNRDGVVTLGRTQPASYRLRVLDHDPMRAFPLPLPLDTDAYLMIPDRLSAAVSNWVGSVEALRVAHTSEAAMQAVVRHFQHNFSYSLAALPGGRDDPLERFMTVRSGHCVLFASAAALMLRAVEVPTRVVAGYYATERHGLTGEWVVRERDGHAWVEAWDASAGIWRLLEPTPSGGLPGGDPAVSRLRLRLEWLDAQWRALRDWIAGINFLLWLAEGTLALWLAVEPVLLSIGFWTVALIGLALWRWLRRPRRELDPAVRLRQQLIRSMRRFERRHAPPGSGRRPHETWETWWRNLAPRLDAAKVGPLSLLVEEYQRLRYDPDLSPRRIETWLLAARKPAGARRRTKCNRLRP